MSALTEVAAPGTDLPRRRARGRGDGLGPWWLVAAVLPVAFLLVFFAWPVAAMLWRGIGGDADAFTGAVDLTAFGQTLARERTWRILGQTLGMAAAGTVVSVALGLPTAFVLHRRRIPGRAVLRALVLVPFVLPTVVVGVAFRALLAPGGPLGFTGLDQTTTAVVLAMVFFNVSVVVRQVGALWNALDPRQTEAARTLGASPWRAFRTVTLPQLAPAIAASAALVFLFCASAFGIVQTLGRPGYGTLESEIWVQTSVYLDLRTAAVFSVLQFAVVLAAVVVSGVTAARTQRALRLRETPPARLTRADAVPVAVMLAVVALVVAPILTLVVRSFHTRHGCGLGNYRLLSTSAGSGFVGGSTPAQALEQSLRVAVDATLVTLVVAVPLALLLTRPFRSRAALAAQRALDGALLLPLGVSAVPVAVMLAVVALVVAPILTLVVRSFHTRHGWGLGNYRLLSTSAGSGFVGGSTPAQALEQSLRVAVDATLVTLVVAVPLALLLTRPFRSRAALAAQRALDGALLLPLGVSAVTVGFGFVVSLRAAFPELAASGVLVPLAQAVVALPLAVRALVPVLAAVDPRLREAARTHGAGPWRVLATVDGPFLARGVGVAAGFAFAVSLGEFGATSFLASQSAPTLPVLIARLLGRPGADNYGMALAAATVLAVLSAGIMLVCERLRPRGPAGAGGL